MGWGARAARALATAVFVALPCGTGMAKTAPPPARKALNPHVLAILRSYPTDGTHRYWWPKDGRYDGVSRTLRYDGEVVARGEPGGRTFCCGLTFEVWLRACERAHRHRGKAGPLRLAGIDAAGMRRLRSAWYCAAGGLAGPEDALVPRGLGYRIRRLEDARPGDFVQLWRHSGSGHSVIFLAWVREGGRIVGMRYWSTQSSTRGIGVRVERFGPPRGIDPQRLHIVRAALP
ncbi:MAG: hypothetical protein D6776_09925 [Planctomycetota bacterium]|nr:MAG: hypothetical protein D6776_09925 [Planctomycetota bacterium]